ncbi:MAG TPA: hypothetical protein PKN36_01595 [bacterium]|nr:hypothetical protein [bacterium]
MEAGFYETDITPSIGMERPATYYKLYIESIRDPLKVRAAVISDGKERVALVGVDTGALHSGNAVEAARQKIEKLTGIKGSAVMIGASHTHSGGPFHGPLPEDYEDAPGLIKTLISEYSIVPDPLYYRHVIEQIVTAVCEADRRRTKAMLSCGVGFENKVAFNRRCKMKNGRVYTHPGKGNPDILDFAGPSDPDVGVLSAWDTCGKFLGCIVNYSCHGTTLHEGASADWICYMEKTIRGVMGQDAVTVFLNGASGDLTQVNNLSLNEREIGERYANFVGTRVGAEAVKVIASAEKGDFSPVAARQKILKINRRKPSARRVEESRRIVEEGLKANKISETPWLFAKEILVTDYVIGKDPVASVELQGIQIGGAVYLSNPAELFCQLGLDIKEGSPFPVTFVVEIANGFNGYVPDEKAFTPQGGGYETVLTRFSNLEITAGRQIANGCISLAKEFKPGKIPELPRIKDPIPAWDYGMLGPELE